MSNLLNKIYPPYKHMGRSIYSNLISASIPAMKQKEKMKTRFIIIGFGWRADFFYRIAKMMPERFEISAGVLRTQQRAEEVAEKEGVYATENLDEALKTKVITSRYM